MKRLWLRRNLIFGVIALFYVFLGMYISLFPLEYKSTAVLSITPKTEAAALDPSLLKSDIIVSLERETLQTLAQNNKLELYTEYNPSIRPKKILSRLLDQWIEGPALIKPLPEYINYKLQNNIDLVFLEPDAVEITVTSTSPKLAYFLANGLSNLIAVSKSDVLSIKITENAQIPSAATFEKYIFHVKITGFFGAVVGLFFAYFSRPSLR